MNYRLASNYKIRDALKASCCERHTGQVRPRIHVWRVEFCGNRLTRLQRVLGYELLKSIAEDPAESSLKSSDNSLGQQSAKCSMLARNSK